MLAAARQISRNTVLLMIGDGLNKISAVLFLSLAARRLGAGGFGVFTLCQVLGGVLQPLADPGVTQTVLRDAAAAPAKCSSLLSTALLLRWCLLVVSCGLLLALCLLLGYPSGYYAPVLAGGSAVLLISIVNTYHSVFRATNRVHCEVLGFALRLLVLTMLSLAVFILPPAPVAVAAIYGLYAVITLAAVASLARWSGIRLERSSWTEVRRLAARAFPLGLQSLAVVSYQYAGSLLLSKLHTVEEVGYYQAAVRLTTALNIVGTSFTNAVFPFLVSARQGRRQDLSAAYQATLKILLAAGLAIATATTVLAGRLIRLFYGAGFDAAIVPLRILIWAELLIFAGFVTASVLLACDMRWALSLQAVITGAINLVTIWPAIRYGGVAGAAAATLLTEICAIALLTALARRAGVRLSDRWPRELAAALGAAAAMAAGLWMLRDCWLLAQFAAGAVLFTGVIVLVGFFRPEELATGCGLLRSLAGKLCRRRVLNEVAGDGRAVLPFRGGNL